MKFFVAVHKPFVLTPELLNYLRIQFLAGEIPWVAEADFLLSDLCRPVGYELYVIKTDIRAYALKQLEKKFGLPRMQQVARRLINYVRYLDKNNPFMGKQELQAQQWAAMVYLEEERENAVQEITQQFSNCTTLAQQKRLAHIVQELEPQIKNYPQLLAYAAEVTNVLRTQTTTEVVETVSLSSLQSFNLQDFPIEVATIIFEEDGEKPNTDGEIFSFSVPTIEYKLNAINTEKTIKWLFQGSPKRYRMLDAIRDLDEVIWPVKIKSYFKEMTLEDRSIIWVSGKEAGIYALIEIVELFDESQDVIPNDIDYWLDTTVIDNGQNHPKARLRFIKKFLDKPILKEQLKQDQLLKDLLIIRNPRLSRTRVTPEESQRIYQLMDLSGLVITYQTKQAGRYFEALGNGVSLEMIHIPSGTFEMGTEDEEIERLCQEYNRDWFRRESPQHQVTVQSFSMGRYPITQAQWKAVAAMPKIEKELEDDPSYDKGHKRPVENISWHDAIEFCARLSVHTKRNYRLPSEAEWEYACRAGTTTPFHFGETISTDLANYNGSNKQYGAYGRSEKGVYRRETTDVDFFGVANDFGLSDMHGNVWEWCLDPWYGDYNGAPNDGSVWDKNNQQKDYSDHIIKNIKQLLTDGRTHIVRGGSYVSDPRFCRSAYRDISLARDSVGFRVVCLLPRTL
ncbi:MAG: SUMF1/EgtB/PvdO family nonheme iron enzyme [Crocosphaera sp.]